MDAIFKTSHESQFIALVKSLLHSAGYDFRRVKAVANPTFQLLNSLNRFEVDLVFDVGANTGEFAAALLSIGYQGEVVSFEPLSAAHRVLSRAAGRHARWRVHSRVALGDCDGQTKINISANSVSSSLLPIMKTHSSAAEGSGYVGAETVPVFRLDSVAAPYLANAQRPFLKIDTQGFEWQVIDGAKSTFPLLQGVMCELSLVALYEGQHLWREMIQRLEGEGFVLWSIDRGFSNPNDGRTLQFDAVFFRPDVLP